jgi:hypothetical protein
VSNRKKFGEFKKKKKLEWERNSKEEGEEEWDKAAVIYNQS